MARPLSLRRAGNFFAKNFLKKFVVMLDITTNECYTIVVIKKITTKK